MTDSACVCELFQWTEMKVITHLTEPVPEDAVTVIVRCLWRAHVAVCKC